MRCRCIRRSSKPTAGTSASSTSAPTAILRIGVAREPLPHFEATMPRGLRQAPDGSIYEWRSDAIALELGRRVREDGAALIIDYGHARYGLGETLQAVAGHAFTDPLRTPGEADLTAHVDFEALAQCAESIGGAHSRGQSRSAPASRLGIDKRAAALKATRRATRPPKSIIALSRLTASGASGMGELFKAIAIADPKLGSLARI